MSPAEEIRKQAGRIRALRGTGRSEGFVANYADTDVIAALLESEAVLVEQTGRVDVTIWRFVEDVKGSSLD